MKFNKIERYVGETSFAISVEHVPGRKRPELWAHFGNEVRKVGEITDENMLRIVAENIFYDAKVVE